MAVTDIRTHRTIPEGMAALVQQIITQHLSPLSTEDGVNYKVKHYAGEFLAEDNLERLKADVSQFPHVMYDIEVIEEVDIDDSQRMPADRFGFIIFCCHSNRFDESIQWSSSYDLAWDVRRGFQGVSFEAAPTIHANGFFEPQTIERELHVPGMSVHTLRIDATVIHDKDGDISATGGGYNFSISANSHYIPMV